MVAVRDFSGLTSSAWAFARAQAKAATDSLERCMGRLHIEKIEADGPGLRSAGSQAMADRFLNVLRNERLELGLRPLMFEIGAAGAAKQRRELCPGVRRTHVDDADRVNTRSWRLGIDEMRGLAG